MNMGLKLKYTTAERDYELDEGFVDSLSSLPTSYRFNVFSQIEKYAPNLPTKPGWSQVAAGVVRRNPPLFFCVDYIKQPSEPPLFLDIDIISSDEFLDYMNSNQTLAEWKLKKSPRQLENLSE